MIDYFLIHEHSNTLYTVFTMGLLVSLQLQHYQRNDDVFLVLMPINPFHAVYLKWVVTVAYHFDISICVGSRDKIDLAKPFG